WGSAVALQPGEQPEHCRRPVPPPSIGGGAHHIVPVDHDCARHSQNSVVATVVFVHAHPDDEAIFTAGTMCLLHAAGHRVVLVVATGGELGLPHEDADGPAHLAALRRDETAEAAGLLGVARTHFLGYHDSG